MRKFLLIFILCTAVGGHYLSSAITATRDTKPKPALFQRPTKAPKKQCRLKPVCADKIVANTLCVKNDARFKGDVNIDGNLTVHGEITAVRSRWHGWWRKLTKGDYLNDEATVSGLPTIGTPQLIFINAIDEANIQASGYGGTMQYIYEFPNPEESINQFDVKIINDRVLSFINRVNVTTTVDGITGTYPLDFDFFMTIQEGGQYDKLAFVGDYSNATNQQIIPLGRTALYEKLNFNMAVGDQIRPYGNGDNAFTDSNSRRFMFEQIDDLFFGFNNAATSPAYLAERIMPRPERITLRDAIMNDGVERDPVTIYDIQKTQPLKNSGTTTLLVKGICPQTSMASKVRLSGLEGAWQDLNDIEFECAGIYNTTVDNLDAQAPFYLVDTRLYRIVIVKDTSDKPVFDPAQHGYTVVAQPSKIGPITEDIEYREWIDAAIFYTQKVLQQSTHSQIRCFLESLDFDFKSEIDSRLTKAPLATWQDVSDAILGNIPSSFQQYRYKDFFGAEICPTFYLPFWIGFYDMAINEPFLELGIPGSDIFPEDFPEYAIGSLPVLGYNIPFENYLLPESRRWLYFRVVPNTPVSNEQQKNVWALGYDADGNLIPELRGYASVGPNGLNSGDQLGGSRLEGLLSDVPWGEDSQDLIDGFWSPFNGDPFFYDATTFNIGIINPDLVEGRKIGYLYLTDTYMFHDFAQYNISLNINFGNPALASSPDPALRKRQQIDGEASIISALMRYFVEEQQVEAIILDNRVNGGGYDNFSFLESFGASRAAVDNLFNAFQNQDERDAIGFFTDIETYSGTRSDNKTIRKLVDTTPLTDLRPDLMEQRYPGSVFKNGCVIVLTSQYAGSDGDVFPRWFMGENLDGDLGNGVTAHVVGSIDGILEGGSAQLTQMITSKFGSEFPDSDGVGQSPVVVSGENCGYASYQGVPSSTRLDPRTGFIDPVQALVPVNSNLTGPIYAPTNTGTPAIVQGALSTNIGDTVYFDFGYTGPGFAVDGTPYAAGHWDNPPTGITPVDGFPGQPVPSDPSSLRDSWLEEAIRVIRLCLGDEVAQSKRSRSKHITKEPSSAITQAAIGFATTEDIAAHVAKKEQMKGR